MIEANRCCRVVAAALVVVLAGTAQGQGVQLPADANVQNVLTFGAIPNDGLDDLAAFQAAMNAVVGTGRILYVPDGVYNFSDRLNWGGVGSGGFFTLQGQSEAGVILKLNDAAPGFGDPANRRVFIDAYEGNTANQFRNYLRDVTIDVGANNPGAVGLEFQANNTGRIENVTIRSSDPLKRGAVGLAQGFEFPGPMLIRNLTIDGFDEGFVGAPQEYSVVFENLTLRNQRALGMYVWRLPLQIRNLVSQNAVPVLRSDGNPGAWGHVVIDGATLTGVGAASTTAALINANGAGVLVVRNATSAGYGSLVRDESFGVATPVLVPDGFIAQFTTDAPASVNPSPAAIVPIPIEETPDAPQIPLSQWVSVKAFGAIENDNLDDTAAVQAAFATGAAVVYFPSGQYILSDTISVGAGTRRIEGLMSNVLLNAPLTTENRPVFRVGPQAEPEVHISGVNTSFQSPRQEGGGVFIEQAKANTLIIRDGDISYRNTVAGGRLFLENLVGTNMTFTGQKVWARQLNPEGSTFTHVTNDASDLYVLGLKTEGESVVLDNRNRARAVVMGGLIYPSTVVTDRTRPMIINFESSLSASLPESCYITDGFYNVWVRETRNGVMTDFTRAMLPLGRGHSVCGGQIALYNGWISDATPPSAPGTPVVEATTANSVTLSWAPSSDGQSGIARYDVTRDGTPIGSSITESFTVTPLPDGASGTYAVTAVNGSGLSSAPSGSVSASTAQDSTPPRLVDVRVGRDARFVVLRFSEALEPSSAANPASYAIAGPTPVTVVSATPSGDGREVRLTVSGMSSGVHDITLSGLTDRATVPNEIAISTRASFAFDPTLSGTGLTATYWSGSAFVGAPLLTRVDPNVNYIYGLGAPAPGVPSDNFAVRWTGTLRPRFTEDYTISIRSDDGSRVFIDGRLIVGNWFDQAPTERGGVVSLDSSREYDFVVEYYDSGFGASVELFWQSASQPREIIPQAALSPQRLLTTVRTNQGAGADTGLNRVGPSDNGAGSTMGAFHSPASGAFHDAAYWRLDLSPLNLTSNYITEAIGTLTQTGFGIGDGKRLINVFAVNQAPGSDAWVESGPGFVTWQTAPGNTDSGSQASPTEATWISTYLLDNTGFRNNFQADAFSFAGHRLIDAINADTDGRITFLAKRLDASNEGQSWFTKEWPTPDFAPALKVRLAPRCPQVVAAPTPLDTILPGQSITLIARVQGAGPVSYRWQREGVDLIEGPAGASPGGGTVRGSSGILDRLVPDAALALTIEQAQPTDAGQYSLILTNSCGTTSVDVTLSIIASCPVCPADYDNNGGVDGGDLAAFFADFENGATCADVDQNGGVDGGDLGFFFQVFEAGGC